VKTAVQLCLGGIKTNMHGKTALRNKAPYIFLMSRKQIRLALSSTGSLWNACLEQGGRNHGLAGTGALSCAVLV
jgi:hypothetical protein